MLREISLYCYYIIASFYLYYQYYPNCKHVARDQKFFFFFFGCNVKILYSSRFEVWVLSNDVMHLLTANIVKRMMKLAQKNEHRNYYFVCEWREVPFHTLKFLYFFF